VPAAETPDAKGAQTRNATLPGKRMVPIPGRVDGEAAMRPTGLFVGILQFSFQSPICRRPAGVALDKFSNWIPVVQQILRTAAVVGNRRGGIDAEDVIERCQDVLRCVSARDRILAGGVRRPDVLAHAQATA